MKQKMKKAIQIYFRVLSLLLFALLCAEIHLVYTNILSLRSSYIILLLVLLILHNVRNKISWGGIIILCAYGIFNILYYGSTVAYATSMDFTASFRYVTLEGSANPVINWILRLFPVLFYCLNLVLFLTAYVRKLYKMVKIPR